MTTAKGIKFPKFNRNNLQKFFEGCLEAYKENQKNWEILASTVDDKDFYGWGSFYKKNMGLKSDNRLEAHRVLSEACNQDDRVLTAILASYARLCIEGDKIFVNYDRKEDFIDRMVSRLKSNCWCCVLVNLGLDDFFCYPDFCPASSYCFGGLDLELEAYSRNVVIAVCRDRGYPSVWRFLPYISDFDYIRTKFEETLERTVL